MSAICRKCLGKMPPDRKGADQICPKCLPPKKGIRLEVEEIFDRFISYAHHNDGYTNEMIDTAFSAIHSAYLRRLPPKKPLDMTPIPGRSSGMEYDRNSGWNACLQKLKENWK